MTDTQHTPGPWQIGSRYGNNKVEIADASYDRAICTVWTHQDEGSTVEPEKRFQPLPCGAANARLIAAAPDLLAVARESQRLLDILADSLADAGLENEADVSAEFAMVIRAAIAKATGQYR